MASKPVIAELRARLKTAKDSSNNDDRVACCWQGYLAALLEWGLISINDHKSLSEIIPSQEPDPSYEIFVGYEEP